MFKNIESQPLNDSQTLNCTFKYKRSFAFILSGLLLFIYTFYLVQVYLFGGILVGLLALVIVGHVRGIEVDLENKNFRNVVIFGNHAFGSWQPLPKINYVSVFKAIIASSIMGRSGATVTTREKAILVNLIHDKNKRLLVYKTENVEEAFVRAKIFAEKLDVKIYDATTRKGHWLD